MKGIYFALWSGLILLLWPAHARCEQVVRIRIISAKDGRPLKNQPISVSLLYEKTEKVPPNLDPNLSLQTDANGEAQLRLPEPPPAHIGAQVRLTSDNWRCACSALVTTHDVIVKGFTVTATTKKSETSHSLQAQPGEILFAARPLGFFERLLEPFVKQ